jgi:probable addiction module antidote protein
MRITTEDIQTAPYDPAEFLCRPEAQAELLSEALESGDSSYVAHVLGVIARAHGMTEVAREAGLSRETLYRSLSKNGNPELATVMAVLKSLDLSLAAKQYNSPSGPFLEVMREFVRDGKFNEVCSAAKLYFSVRGESKKLILRKFPAIILNQYIFRLSILSTLDIINWLEENSDWPDRISNSVDKDNLHNVVNNIVIGIRDFSENKLKSSIKAA